MLRFGRKPVHGHPLFSHSLSSYLEAVATGKSNALRETLDADQMKAMQTLVEKYSQFAEVPSSTKTPPEKLTVVSQSVNRPG